MKYYSAIEVEWGTHDITQINLENILSERRLHCMITIDK